MRKEQIQAFIDSYNNVNSGNLFDLGLKKGIRKRLFGLRTRGIKELENFMKSDGMRNLGPEKQISDENLKQLCQILEARDDRIYGTRRSYEKYPDKSTNKVFQHIYELLWLDLAGIQSNQGKLKESDEETINHTILKREAYKKRSEFEKNPNEVKMVNDTYMTNACQLGIALLEGTQLHSSDYEDKLKQHTPSGENDLLQSITIKCTDGVRSVYGILKTALNKIFSLDTISENMVFDKDVKNGIKWLDHAAKKGDKIASFKLAKVYAGGASKVSEKEVPINADKAIKYLKLAKEQGSRTATQLLENGGTLGQIDVPKERRGLFAK